MTKELDHLLNEFDDKTKKQRAERIQKAEEEQKKIASFKRLFKKRMTTTLEPVLKRMLSKIHKHGHETQRLDIELPAHKEFYHKSYVIRKGRGGNFVMITIVGNHHLQKVMLYTEYSPGYHTPKTENSYPLPDFTEDLLSKIITDEVSKILK